MSEQGVAHPLRRLHGATGDPKKGGNEVRFIQGLMLVAVFTACQGVDEQAETIDLGVWSAFDAVDFALPGLPARNDWTLASGALPPGVTLSQDGAVGGSPSADGRFEFAVMSSSQPTQSYTVAVEYGENVIACGRSITVPLAGGQDMFGYPVTGDFSDPALTTWVLIPPSVFDNLQIDLELETEQDAEFFGLVPEQVGIPGEGDLLNIGWISTGTSFRMRSGGQTDPAWWADSDGPAAVAFGSAEPGMGTLTMTCDSGPLAQTWDPLPGVEGEGVYWRFQATGEGLTYATSSTLPPGTALDGSDGSVSGVATAAGSWTLDLDVTDSRGNERTFPVEVQVAPAPLVATCGETVTYTMQTGGRPGQFPRELGVDYRVIVDIDVPVGLRSLTVRALDDDPNPWFAFTDVVTPAQDVLDERWPGLALAEGQRVRGFAGALAEGTHSLTVDCEEGLRVVDAGSISVDIDEPYTLQAVGGEPPYEWSLSRTRSDLSISTAGVVELLRYQRYVDLGDIEVTDSAGATARTGAYLVDQTDACANVPPIGCGERVEWDGANEEYPHVCVLPEQAGVLRTSAHPLATMRVTGAPRIPPNGHEAFPRPEAPDLGWSVPIPERLVGTALTAELQMFTTGWRPYSGWFEYVCDD